MQLQSGLVQKSSNEGNSDETSGLVNFDDHLAGEAIDLPATIRSEQTTVGLNSELHKFLSRPVNIYTYTWALGGTSSINFDPWFEFLNRTSIKKRVDNYYLLRANLKLKFIINAAPFYYGCMLVSYNPLKSFSAPYIGSGTNIAVPLSQLPRVYLYPSASQGASMTLPFVYHRQWLDVTSATDVRNMGNVIFTVLDSLKNSNGATSSINVQVYAWMEDVQLSGPTVGLSLQSGKADEYGKGIISTTATAVARAAGELAKAPIIGPYATATSILASAGATLAKTFGYTNVPVVEDVHSLKPSPFPHMSSTDIGTSIEKLSLDSKNELTIDPKVCGANFGDELEINNITGRESYVTKFTWTTANVANDLLFNIRVTPRLMATASGTSQTIVNGVPMWMVSRMFTNWRGDIEYRFKVICSQYHRGRLRFSWDPNGAIATTTESTTEVYTKIVDIAESTDVVLRIPYMSDVAWLYTGDTIDQVFNTTAVSKIPFYENGVLTVRCLTELTAPITTADISILVFARGADNLEFANPKNIDYSNTLAPFTVQSGLLAYDNEDEDISSIALVPSEAPPENDLIYMGETVKSLRTLLRRAQFVRTACSTVTISATNPNATVRIWFNRFPPSPGYDPNGINQATGLVSGTSKSYNFVPYNTITWIGQCFLGCRGSIMWYANTMTSTPLRSSHLGRCARSAVTGIAIATSDYQPNILQSSNANLTAALTCQQYNSQLQGYSLTNQRTNSSNSAVIPFYSIYKFRQCYPGTAVIGTYVADSQYDVAEYYAQLNPKVDATANASFGSDLAVNFYCAAGADFNYVFFLAVPTLFAYASTPVGV